MDGIEKITGRIAEDAQREIDALLADARAQADEIAARFDAQARRESEEILERGRRNADERVERLASVAQMEARKLELAAKQEVLAKAYDTALEQLLALPEGEYAELLASLAAKAAATGTEEIILNAKDRAAIGAKVVELANARRGSTLTLSDRTADISGGLLLSDGSVEVNCSFETLVRLQRSETDREAAAILFE